MHRKITYLFIYLFICLFKGNSQINFVPNSSFEDTVGACDYQMAVTNSLSKVKKWYVPSYYNTPDYYNTCANSITYPNWSTIPYNAHCYQLPHTGIAYLGLYNYIVSDANDSAKIDVEYISVKLNKSLQQDKCYYGEMYVNLGNIGEIAVNQISILFTQNTFTTSQFSYTNTIQPQIQWDTTQFFTDTLNWIKISGKFIAQGGEEYLTIGNFKDGKHTKKTNIGSNFTPGFGAWPNPRFYSYILIDDVSLYEISKPNLGNDKTLCGDADSLIIGDVTLNNNGTNVKWYKNNTPLVVSSNTVKISAMQTATYIMQYEGCTADTLVITYNAECPKEPYVYTEPIIPNVFTPNSDEVNDVWRFMLPKGVTLSGVEVYNRWGNLIYQRNNTPNPTTNNSTPTTVLWDGRTTSGEECSSGVYYYTLQFTDANGDEHKKNGYITLIR